MSHFVSCMNRVKHTDHSKTLNYCLPSLFLQDEFRRLCIVGVPQGLPHTFPNGYFPSNNGNYGFKLPSIPNGNGNGRPHTNGGGESFGENGGTFGGNGGTFGGNGGGLNHLNIGESLQ